MRSSGLIQLRVDLSLRTESSLRMMPDAYLSLMYFPLLLHFHLAHEKLIFYPAYIFLITHDPVLHTLM
jgi:hypothetical protein